MAGSWFAAAKRKRSPNRRPRQLKARSNRRTKMFASFQLPMHRPDGLPRAMLEIHEPPAAGGIQMSRPPPEAGPNESRCEGSRRRFGNRPARSDVQIDDFQRVVLDKLSARLDVFAHQRRENILCRNGVFKLYLKQRACVRVQGRVPQLLGVHFAESLESRDGEILLGIFNDVIE